MLGYHAPMLRAIAEQAGLEPLARLARRPDVHVLYRISVSYFDGRARSSAATLTRFGVEGVELALVFLRALGHKPLLHPITLVRYDAWAKALSALRFDQLDDQDHLPEYPMADLWLIERASGTFVKSVILAPALADGVHAQLAQAVRTHLPEALRELK
jgi:hypothetical protein